MLEGIGDDIISVIPLVKINELRAPPQCEVSSSNNEQYLSIFL